MVASSVNLRKWRGAKLNEIKVLIISSAMRVTKPESCEAARHGNLNGLEWPKMAVVAKYHCGQLGRKRNPYLPGDGAKRLRLIVALCCGGIH